MKYTLFTTPTTLDIRAITTFGLHAKPNTTSPIGYFGTGLKMAIATLCRENIPVELYIGKSQYVFKPRNIEFRNESFQQIIMLRKKSLASLWEHYDLPFTTELAKNWELWMAYRELESNTRDEEGATFLVDENTPDGMSALNSLGTNSELTVIKVHGPIFAAVHEQVDTIFLPGASRKDPFKEAVPGIEIFPQSSKYVYYRGMRVLELKKPSLMTYNVLEQHQLTEDRTLKDQFWLQYKLAEWLMTKVDEQAILNNLLTASEQYWEWDLPYDIVVDEPSELFQRTYKQKRGNKDTKTLQHARNNSAGLWASPRLESMFKKLDAVQKPVSQLLSTRFHEFRMQWLQMELEPHDNELLDEVEEFIAEHEQKTEESAF